MQWEKMESIVILNMQADDNEQSRMEPTWDRPISPPKYINIVLNARNKNSILLQTKP